MIIHGIYTQSMLAQAAYADLNIGASNYRSQTKIPTNVV